MCNSLLQLVSEHLPKHLGGTFWGVPNISLRPFGAQLGLDNGNGNSNGHGNANANAN